MQCTGYVVVTAYPEFPEVIHVYIMWLGAMKLTLHYMLFDQDACMAVMMHSLREQL